MSQPLAFDDLNIGDRWKSRSRTITESDVVNFAGMTGDFDPLHVDHTCAEESPFKRPIAHGLLGLSFLAGLSSNSPWTCTVAFLGIDGWKFLKPIYIGDTVHVVTEVVDLQPNGRRRGRVRWKRQLINQQDEIVQEGYLETVVTMSHARMAAHDTAIEQKHPTDAIRVAG